MKPAFAILSLTAPVSAVAGERLKMTASAIVAAMAADSGAHVDLLNLDPDVVNENARRRVRFQQRLAP